MTQTVHPMPQAGATLRYFAGINQPADLRVGDPQLAFPAKVLEATGGAARLLVIDHDGVQFERPGVFVRPPSAADQHRAENCEFATWPDAVLPDPPTAPPSIVEQMADAGA